MGTRTACPQFYPSRTAGRRQRTLLASMSLFLLPMWLLAFPASGAREGEDLEHSVKAAFLYKFASYVEWPASVFPQADTPIAIAVAGSEAIAAELGRLVASRTAQGRSIVVKRLTPGDPLAGVHILFVGPSEVERLAQWARDAQAHSTLLVTDSRGALERGSAINFVLVDRRVRFEISLDAAEKSSLKLSSRLLAVAQRVHPGAP